MSPRALPQAGLLLFLGTHAALAQSSIRDSGRVWSPSDVSEQPVLLTQPTLGYRQCLQDAGVRGRKTVEFIIDSTGRVEAGSILLERAGPAILDSLATAAARELVFRPARADGLPVRFRAVLPLDFGATASTPDPVDSGVFALDCVDTAPMVKSRERVLYPEDLRRAGVTGEVLFEFVVDSEGRVDRRSIRLVRATRHGLAPSPRRVIERAEFAPALLAGEAVRCRVRLRFVFRISPTLAKYDQPPGELGPVVITAWPQN